MDWPGGLSHKTDRLLLLAAIVVATGLAVWCWASRVLGYTSSPTIRYEVSFDTGLERDAVVRYALPGGAIKTDQVRTPWTSQGMTFGPGDEMSLWASVDAASIDDPVRCDFVSGEDIWSPMNIGEDPRICVTTWQLGRWPPDEMQT